ncbi:hypothetical protein Ancab_038677 [Ancistrocladus abbreviatus]
MDTSNEQKVSVANSFENSDSHGQKARVTKNSSKTGRREMHPLTENQPPNAPRITAFQALFFRLGGYAGNLFHDFSDIIVPLYITSRHFNGEVQFLVANVIPWWLGKYRILLKALSKYDIIDIDGDQEIHCFRSMTVGLKSHKEFGFDP